MKKTSIGTQTLVCLMVLSLISGLPAQESISIVGCGSTIPSALYRVWGSAYTQRNPRVQVKYLPLGSGEGINQITAGAADFGAGEIPISDKAMRETGKNIRHLPLFLSAVVPIYNVPGVSQLRFSGKVLGDMFDGAIKRWNHPDLAKLNPGVQLPNLAITTVHREPGKGTTYLFTDFLSKSNPGFRAQIGTDASPKWRSGLGAEGGQDLVKQVNQTPGAIGYAELNVAKAGGAAVGLVQNASGEFVEATPESAAAACPAIVKGDFRISLTNRPGKNVYPITGFSWMFVPTEGVSQARTDALRSFLKFIFTDGQAMTEAHGHLPLPPEVVASVLSTMEL
jgi:phosphate transport system substrate-binding protein